MIAELENAAAIKAGFFFTVIWCTFKVQRANVEGGLDHVVEIVGVGTGETAISCFGAEGVSIVFRQDGEFSRMVIELGDVEKLFDDLLTELCCQRNANGRWNEGRPCR